MARASQIPAKQESKQVFKLATNFGWIDGIDHRFIAKGTEFDEQEDAEMIAFLIRSGAKFVKE